jgi:D-tyrosyl-tRNA(Tyr) deacylase
MRAVIQRVNSASVSVSGTVTGNIDHGLVVLLGIESADTAGDVAWLAAKTVSLRLFEDEGGQMARSVIESGGGILLVSQFTLFASTKKGAKPSWHRAAKPDHAQPLYEHAVAKFAEALGRPVATGLFGAMMHVALVNDGPVTLLLDTKARE